LDYLSVDEAAPFYEFCLELFKTYLSADLGKKYKTNIKVLANENEREQYQDLVSMLKILHNISEQPYSNPKTINVIFYGLSIIMPLISTEILQYPKVSKFYFTLVSSMFTRHTASICGLPLDLFTTLVTSLEWSIKYQDTSKVRSSLEAVCFLATFNYETKMKGRDALQPAQRDIMSQFLESLLKLLIYEPIHMELLEMFSNCVLALICSEQMTFKAIAQRLIDQETVARGRLAQTLSNLMNQITISLDRKSKSTFREQLRIFIIQSRSFVRMK